MLSHRVNVLTFDGERDVVDDERGGYDEEAGSEGCLC